MERMKTLILVPVLLAFGAVSACSTGKLVRAAGDGIVQLADEINEEFIDPDERDMVVQYRVLSQSPLQPTVLVTEPCSVDPKRKDEAHLPLCPEDY